MSTDAASSSAPPPAVALLPTRDGTIAPVSHSANHGSNLRSVRADASGTGVAALAANAELSASTSVGFRGLTTAPPPEAGRGPGNPTGVPAAEVDASVDFHPFETSTALPQLSPLSSPNTSADSDDKHGANRNRRHRNHRHNRGGSSGTGGTTDSFTESPSYADEEEGELQRSVHPPSPHAIATAFTPLRRDSKIERTQELMERVARVKAQFRARQLAAGRN